VPAGRIYRARDMLDDPHFLAREAIVAVDHPEFGRLQMHNVAPRLSDTPGAVRAPGPELGEHNAEVYGGLLGLSDTELDHLQRDEII
jgi:formyl-CoA transferase